jgi:hypothetical protein
VRTDSAAFGALSFETEGGVSFAKVSGRQERNQGSLYFDLDRACLLPSEPWSYAVHARSRRDDGGKASGSVSVSLHFGDGKSTSLKGISTEDGWQRFINTGTVTFSAEQLANGEPYLEVLGAQPGETIELSKVRFERADPSFYQPPTGDACAELVTNGDFSMDDDFIWPWSYRERRPHKLVSTATSENLLVIWGRKSSASSVEQTIDASCLVPGTAYAVSAQVIQENSSPCFAPGSDRSTCARIVLRTRTRGGSIRQIVVATQSTFNGNKGDYNAVEGTFTLPDHVGDVDVETAWLSLEADDDGASSMMNWRSVFVTKISAPAIVPVPQPEPQSEPEPEDGGGNGMAGALVDTLVLPRSIEPCWTAGAELLVTSWTSNLNDAQTVKIRSVAFHSRDQIAVALDAPIRKPTTFLDSADFGIEVALLDRNTKIVGGSDGLDAKMIGGHIIVMHTPGVAQIMRGVLLSKLGQQVGARTARRERARAPRSHTRARPAQRHTLATRCH